MSTLSDVTVGAANYMLGYLQMAIAGGESITPDKWQQAIEETVAFQHRMISTEKPLEPPC
ncbi:hypothetical protein V3C33_13795 [Micrococcaceae bacterium Sec5.7]